MMLNTLYITSNSRTEIVESRRRRIDQSIELNNELRLRN